ncbi:DUF1987 domain-containing protein [Geothrix sp. 21YS21S-2]|uniref:DUF1987 domain-containing protein n=1 Tax=Geothrix sp. 21YS21S-2 TaxID=3068893 RepID=UPI0027BA4FF7|nr:DUF1987 domain-containing protein [Geothrix sp. 21YS21S-2]
MENIYLPARERSPEVDFRFTENHLSLRGEAYPEDAASFFGPLLKALASHCESIHGRELRVDFQLIYFNTSSAKALMNLIQILEATASDGTRVVIRWLVQEDDDVMREFGEDFSGELKNVHFELIQI